MSKVKYRVREFVPKGQQSLGNHSWFAEVVINNDVDNDELARKIAARTGFKSYECQAIVAAIADIVAEEVKESNRVFLADEKGTKMVSLYPKVQGSVSDAEVLANPEISRTVRRYDGTITEVNPTYTIVMKSGKTDDIIELFRALDAFDCVLQYTRSGRIAVTRGMQEQVSAFLEEREEIHG